MANATGLHKLAMLESMMIPVLTHRDRRSPSAEMDRWVAMRFPCGFTQRLAKTGPWNYISGFLIQFSTQWCKNFRGKRRQWKIFFSPIGMYIISAHWDHMIHARCAHSKLKLDDDIKNTCIDIVQWLYSIRKILPFFR